ncbi:hypothetical protein PVK06_026685 [Gossypium arboreum]|uniref:Uncharacterized protein n=1 Tax=Gossypium arboreum TaxID=29729 RepID=A0ABR0NYA3_GOSAR|nr:hypothetical protein PVK06_026685 [Gossypium arboreum]
MRSYSGSKNQDATGSNWEIEIQNSSMDEPYIDERLTALMLYVMQMGIGFMSQVRFKLKQYVSSKSFMKKTQVGAVFYHPTIFSNWLKQT